MFVKPTKGLVVNLGNPNETSIVELAKMVIDKTGSKSKIEFKDAWVDDPKRRRPDISKAKKVLRWQPEISLDEGLEKTIEYFKKETH